MKWCYNITLSLSVSPASPTIIITSRRHFLKIFRQERKSTREWRDSLFDLQDTHTHTLSFSFSLLTSICFGSIPAIMAKSLWSDTGRRTYTSSNKPLTRMIEATLKIRGKGRSHPGWRDISWKMILGSSSFPLVDVVLIMDGDTGLSPSGPVFMQPLAFSQ